MRRCNQAAESVGSTDPVKRSVEVELSRRIGRLVDRHDGLQRLTAF
jgi:hypothetical protein